VEKIYDELKKINKKLEKLDALDQRIIAIEGTVQGLVHRNFYLHNMIHIIKILKK